MTFSQSWRAAGEATGGRLTSTVTKAWSAATQHGWCRSRSSPNLATKHIVFDPCLPSQRGMDIDMNLADPTSVCSCGCSRRACSHVSHGPSHKKFHRCHTEKWHDTSINGRLHRFHGTDVQRQCVCGDVLFRTRFTPHDLHDSSCGKWVTELSTALHWNTGEGRRDGPQTWQNESQQPPSATTFFFLRVESPVSATCRCGVLMLRCTGRTSSGFFESTELSQTFSLFCLDPSDM